MLERTDTVQQRATIRPPPLHGSVLVISYRAPDGALIELLALRRLEDEILPGGALGDTQRRVR